jgi:hypothetical protein
MEVQKQQQANLTTYSKQSAKQIEILELVRTKEEEKLVNLCFSKLIRTLRNEELHTLNNCVGFWAATLGVVKDFTSVELKMISTFIFNQFGNLTIKEIEYAIELSLAGKLNCDAELYGKNLSVSYVGKILSSYVEYKRNELKDLNYRLQSKQKPQKEITAQEKMYLAKESVVLMYREYQEKKVINDPFNTTYSLLRKIKLLNPNQEEINLAMEYGKKVALEEKDKLYSIYTTTRKQEKVDIDLLIKRYARNYCVGLFFEKNELNLILEKINLEQFTENGDKG